MTYLLVFSATPAGRNRLENGSSKAFAAAFAALGSLVEVRMPQNGIRMEGIEAIVTALRKNPDLEVLDLQDNTATLVGSRAIAASLPSFVSSSPTPTLTRCAQPNNLSLTGSMLRV